jgi:hypothetical protein
MIQLEWECCQLTQRPEYSSQPYKHHPGMQQPQSQSGYPSTRELPVGCALLFREVVLRWCGIILSFTKHSRRLISIPSSTVYAFSPCSSHTEWFFRVPTIFANLSGMSVVVLVLVYLAVVSLAEQLDRYEVVPEELTSGIPGSETWNTTQERNAFKPRSAQCNANALEFCSNQRKAEGSKLPLVARGPEPYARECHVPEPPHLG